MNPTWTCRLFAKCGGAYPLTISTNNPPNAFHRLMQRLILGHEWVKL